MRVVVTHISQDGTMWRRMVDTAASSDVGPWEELTARALPQARLSTPVWKARRVDERRWHLVSGLGEQPLAAAGHDREDEQVQFVQWAVPGSQLTRVAQYRTVS